MCPGGRPLGRVLSNRCVGRNAPERMIIPTHTGVFTAHVTARMDGAVPHDLNTPRATGGSAMSSWLAVHDKRTVWAAARL